VDRYQPTDAELALRRGSASKLRVERLPGATRENHVYLGRLTSVRRASTMSKRSARRRAWGKYAQYRSRRLLTFRRKGTYRVSLAFAQNDTDQRAASCEWADLVSQPSSFTDTTNGGYPFSPRNRRTSHLDNETRRRTLHRRPEWTSISGPASFLTMRGTAGLDVTNQSDKE